MAPTRKVGDQLGVFIIGMRRDVKHAAHLVEVVQIPENDCRWRWDSVGRERCTQYHNPAGQAEKETLRLT